MKAYPDTYRTVTHEYDTQRSTFLFRHTFRRSIELGFTLLTFPLVGLLIAVIAIVLLCTQGSPVFYRQQRRGLNRKEFTILKFRTMPVKRDEYAVRTTHNTEASSRFATLLRTTHADELPQWWNILRGDMHIIGPRPLAVSMSDECCSAIPGFSQRYRVKPGLTGLAQLLQGATHTLDDDEIRLVYDLYYIRKRNVVLLLRILVATLAYCTFFPQLARHLLLEYEADVRTLNSMREECNGEVANADNISYSRTL
ncbi:MAG: sugar transferase [Candidatus Kapabacteria bacterium]|nr:sugar transferase [Candidatus Kapabacteria bacterium]